MIGIPTCCPSKKHPKEEDVVKGNPEETREKPILVAICDYTAAGPVELNLTKGEEVKLEEEDKSQDWLLVKNDDGDYGYVPKNIVAQIGTPESKDYYFGLTTRREAENILGKAIVPPGSFLVRLLPSEEPDRDKLILSMRNVEKDTHNKPVDHFVIFRDDYDNMYQLGTKFQPKFEFIKELISYYRDNESNLLRCKLGAGAERPVPSRRDLSKYRSQMWEIDRNEVVLGRKLGAGNYADVYYAQWRRVGKPISVAVKQVKEGRMCRMEFIQEAATMKQLHHKHLVLFYGVCAEKDPFWIITEFMPNGALVEYLQKRKTTKLLPGSSLIDICAQVARGMYYLEKKRLIHRDLAARNCLVGKMFYGIPQVKISDFGLARVLSEGEDIYQMKSTQAMPVKWLAPECLEKHEFTSKSDIWAFGVLTYEVFTHGEVPYKDITNARLLLDYLKDGKRLPKPDRMPENVYRSIVILCWEMEPEKRPDFLETLVFLEDLGTSSCSEFSLETNL